MFRTDFFVRSVSCAVLILPGLVLLLPLQGDEAPVQAKGYALLVGVNEFDKGKFHKDLILKNLDFCENDVEELKKLLDRPGSRFHGNVRLLTCTLGKKDASKMPTAKNIRDGVTWLTTGRKPDEMILVALASHGFEQPMPQTRNVERKFEDTDPLAPTATKDRSIPFFCPSDAQWEGTNWKTRRNEHLINLKEGLLQELGKKCNAGVKLLLMDACRNPIGTRSTNNLINPNISNEDVPSGVSALFSCKSGEQAQERAELKHGVFFYFVLEGLRGEAKDTTGEVSWGTLTSHVQKRMGSESAKTYTHGRQTPHFVANNDSSSDLVLVRLSNSPLERNGGPLKNGEIRPPRRELRTTGQAIKNSINMLLMPLPPGKFTMGSPTTSKRNNDEKQHEVEIKVGFLIGAGEVTQEEYHEVMGSNPSAYCKGGLKSATVRDLDTWHFPVESVSWTDANKFCATLSERATEKAAGRVYRLPTEAEWEYACREGKRTTMPFHFGTSLSASQANFDWRSPFGGGESGVPLDRTCPVGKFEANAFGLYDMHGNVREWCSDWYAKDYYSKSPLSDPQGPDKGSYRVVRGGSWMQDGFYCRSTQRDKLDPEKSNDYTGFRVVCVIRP